MTKREEIYEKLFTRSDCLKLESLRKYNSLELNEKEKNIADSHLQECEMCSDALEGFELVRDKSKLSSLVTEINENLLKEKKTHTQKTIKGYNRIFYYAAAASILVLFGVFSYLKFYFEKSETDISVVSKQTNEETIQPSAQPPEKEYIQPEINSEKKPEVAETTPRKQSQKPIEKEKFIDDKQASIISIEKEDLEKIEENLASLEETEEMDKVSGQSEDEFFIDSSVDIASMGQPVEYFIEGIVVSKEMVSDEELSEYSVDEEAVPQNSAMAVESKPSKVEKKSKERSRKKSGKKASPEAISDEISNEIPEADPGLTEDNLVFTVIDQMPEFPGGQEALTKYLKENIHYPDSAVALGIQGKVYVTFIIKETGEISDIEIKRGIGGGCDDLALRVVELMPDWSPGLQRGKPVRAQITMPVVFKLD